MELTPQLDLRKLPYGQRLATRHHYSNTSCVQWCLRRSGQALSVHYSKFNLSDVLSGGKRHASRTTVGHGAISGRIQTDTVTPKIYTYWHFFYYYLSGDGYSNFYFLIHTYSFTSIVHLLLSEKIDIIVGFFKPL